MRVWTSCLLVTVFLGCATRLRITEPEAGENLFTNTAALIQAKVNRGELAEVSGSIDVDGPGGRSNLASGDIRWFSVRNVIGTPWDLEDVQPGRYRLTVSAVIRGRALRDSVDVNVLSPPEFNVSITGRDRTADGARVSFEITATKFTDGAALNKVGWTFGDGSDVVVTREGRIDHVYPPGLYTVGVEVFDTFGGQSLKIFTLDLKQDQPQFLLTRAPACGCKSMTVHTRRATSFTYCGAPDLAYRPNSNITPRPNDCPKWSSPYTVDRGPIDPSPPEREFGFAFEVEAKLMPGSEHTSCTEGQYARGLVTVGQVPEMNPVAAQRPPVGTVKLPPIDPTFTFTAIGPPLRLPTTPPDYGADGYAKPGRVKRHLGDSVQWIDQPRVRLGGAINATIEKEFVMFVTGLTGTCYCVISFSREITAGIPGATRSRKVVPGLECTLN